MANREEGRNSEGRPGRFRIFLDTPVLVRRPEVLASKHDDVDLILPDVVIAEIKKHASRISAGAFILGIVGAAIDAGTVRVERTAPFPSSRVEDRQNLSIGDEIILEHVVHNADERTIVATDDRALAAALNAAGVETLSTAGLVEFLSLLPKRRSPSVAQKVGNFHAVLIIGALVMAAIGMFAAYRIAIAGVLILTWFIDRLGIFAIVFPLVAGLFFFWFKYRSPFYYGFSEVGVGMLAGGGAYLKLKTAVDVNAAEISTVVLALTGGAYIAVRGLDNMHKASKKIGWVDSFLNYVAGVKVTRNSIAMVRSC